MSDDLDRQHPATGKRRGEFAAKGQVAKSRELNAAINLMFGAWILYKMGASMGKTLLGTTARILSNIDRPLDRDLLLTFGACFLQIVLPVALMGALGAILSHVLQRRQQLTFKLPGFDFSHLNVLPKLIKLLDVRSSSANVGIMLLKVIVLGTVFYLAASDPIRHFVGRVPSSIGAGLLQAGQIFKTILFRGLFVFFLFGLIDFAINWWRLEQRMKMSTQEVRDEAKDANGDMGLRNRRRKMARDLLQKRFLTAVPKADVVVVNPTHVAVALLYDDKKMEAPMVVAKGGDEMAERIRAIARRHQVPIVSQPPLARLLYKEVKVGRTVPAQMFQAVAVVLAHCYRLKKRAA